MGLAGLTLPRLQAQVPAAATDTAIGESRLGPDEFSQSADVKIHYVTSSTGPLVVMIHGFPDYWFTWRKQMPALAESFQVVAIDHRGDTKSDQPAGVKNYRMKNLVGDVEAVIRHFGREKTVVVGHRRNAPELVTRTMVDWLKR